MEPTALGGMCVLFDNEAAEVIKEPGIKASISENLNLRWDKTKNREAACGFI